MKKRSEADSKYTWKLEDMVAEDSQWEQMFKEASGEISEYASYNQKNIHQNPMFQLTIYKTLIQSGSFPAYLLKK